MSESDASKSRTFQKWREDLGLNTYEAARALGVSRTVIWRIEKHGNEPSLTVQLAMEALSTRAGPTLAQAGVQAELTQLARRVDALERATVTHQSTLRRPSTRSSSNEETAPMAEHSHIEWTDATWNPITGCSVVSPGCTNCYAMRLAGTRLKNHPSRVGLTQATKAGPVWTGEVRLNADWLDQPLRWRRPRRIFVCAHGDLFHEDVPDAWIDQVFARMALAPRHTFQVLTKRAARMRAYLSDPLVARRIGAIMDEISDEESEGWFAPVSDGAQGWLEAAMPLPNVWLGVSAEDQPRADERVPELLATPAAVRFVSYEPALGPVDFTAIQAPRYVPEDHELDWKFSALDTGDYYQFEDSMGVWEGGDGPWRDHALDWIIAGGENGDRPMHPDWARDVRDACAAARVPFFFKQWGSWATKHDRDVDDPDWRDSADIARWPNSRWLNVAGGHGFHGERVVRVQNVGKKAAGRLLDGVEHNAMPEVRP